MAKLKRDDRGFINKIVKNPMGYGLWVMGTKFPHRNSRYQKRYGL